MDNSDEFLRYAARLLADYRLTIVTIDDECGSRIFCVIDPKRGLIFQTRSLSDLTMWLVGFLDAFEMMSCDLQDDSSDESETGFGEDKAGQN